MRRLNVLLVAAALVLLVAGCRASGSDGVEAAPSGVDDHVGEEVLGRAPAGPPGPVNHIEAAIRSDVRFRDAMTDFRACMRQHGVFYTITDHPGSLWNALGAFEPPPEAPEAEHANFRTERSRVLQAHDECEPPLRDVQNAVQQDHLAEYQSSWKDHEIPAR